MTYGSGIVRWEGAQEGGDASIHTADILCCTAEINTML